MSVRRKRSSKQSSVVSYIGAVFLIILLISIAVDDGNKAAAYFQPPVSPLHLTYHLTPPPPTPTATPVPDNTPPESVFEAEEESNAYGWYRRTVSGTFQASDDMSGVGRVMYRWESASPYVKVSEADNGVGQLLPIGIAGEGQHLLEYYAIDNLLNTEAVNITSVSIDLTAPTITATLRGWQLPNGWYNSPVSVTLSGQDNLSGIAARQLQLNNAAWLTTTAPTVISRTGRYTLAYRALDRAGNRSEEERITLDVDLTPPTTTHVLSHAPNANGWHNAPLTVTLSAVDTGSGVWESKYRLDGVPGWLIYGGIFPLSNEGSRTLEYYSTDRALNNETPHNVVIPLDMSPPVLTPTLSGVEPGQTGWYSGAVTFSLTASDALAGLDRTEYALNPSTGSGQAGNWQVYTAPVVITAGGWHTLTMRGLDRADNFSQEQQTSFGIDAFPPTTTLQASGQPRPGGWYTESVTVTLSAVDNESGLAQSRYRLNPSTGSGQAGNWQVYTAPLTIGDEGGNTLDYYSSDYAANAESIQSSVINIDSAPPTATFTLEGLHLVTGWHNGPITLTLNATDTTGIDHSEYALGGSGWLTYTAPVVIRASGWHTVAARAIDLAGNISQEQEAEFGIDTLPPTTTHRLTPPPNSYGWRNAPVTVTLIATDTESGVLQSQYRFDGNPQQMVYGAPFTYDDEGNHSLSYYSIDRALNIEATQTTTFQLDLHSPSISYTLQGEGLNPPAGTTKR